MFANLWWWIAAWMLAVRMTVLLGEVFPFKLGTEDAELGLKRQPT